MEKHNTPVSRERAAMLESIYEHAPSAIIELDLEPAPRIIRHNATASELSGLSGDFTLEQLKALVEPEDYKRCAGAMKKAALTGSQAKLECSLTRPNGARRFFVCFINVFTDGSGAQTVVCTARDDTETRENAELMRQNYLRYRTIIDMNSICAYELDYVKKEVSLSPGSRRLFGLSSESLSFDDAAKTGLLFEGDYDEYMGALKRAMSTGAKDSRQLRLKHSDGSVRWHRLTIQPVANEQDIVTKLICVVEDVDTALETQRVMASVVEADHDALMLIDTSNRTYRRFYRGGMSASIPFGDAQSDEPLCSLVQQIMKKRGIQDADMDELTQKLSMANVRETLRHCRTFTFVCKLTLDGEPRFKKLRLQSYDATGMVYIAIITDVTADTMEERRKQQQLEGALCDAEQAAQAKQDFLSNMSHEIRTPLNGIKGMLDLLHQRNELKDDTYVNNALNATDHLTALINDILDMSRIDSGKVELKPIATSCAELLSYIDSIIAPMAQEKGINLIAETDCRGCEYIMADSGRLKQIMLNILTNAVKYTNYGGRIRSAFKLEKRPNGRARLSFTVADSGIGMSPEFIRRAFEPFEQEKQDGARPGTPGTGLGLAITRRLINLMRGTISVDSEQGVGTRVYVEMEVDTATAGDLELRSTAAKEPKTLLLNRKRALIVEDNELNMEIADIQIRSFGLKTERAYDGEQAIEKFTESKPGYFDIVFMDIMMPKKDGLEAAQEIRASGRADARTVKIIAMTANAFIEDIHKSRESGMDMHLSKPFDRKDLAAVLSTAFGAQS